MSLYALNLFDLADNDDYRRYSRRSVEAVTRHGGSVVALGRLAGSVETDAMDAAMPGAGSEAAVGSPREVMILVEWPSRDAFDAFLADPDHDDLHPLREQGTERYLWWLYERLEDLRPVFVDHRAPS